MGARGPGLQLGVELAADEPRVIRQLHDLDQLPVGRQSAQAKSLLHEQVAVLVGYFVPVAMALAHFGLSVYLGRARTASQAARVSAKAHRSTDVGNVLLRLHQ